MAVHFFVCARRLGFNQPEAASIVLDVRLYICTIACVIELFAWYVLVAAPSHVQPRAPTATSRCYISDEFFLPNPTPLTAITISRLSESVVIAMNTNDGTSTR